MAERIMQDGAHNVLHVFALQVLILHIQCNPSANLGFTTIFLPLIWASQQSLP